MLGFCCTQSGIYCCGKSWEKPSPELMGSAGHPAPQVACGSLANRLTRRDVPLITVISAAPLPRSALSCSSRHSPAPFSGSDLNGTQRLQAAPWNGEGGKNVVCVSQTCAEAQTDTRVMMILWSLPFLGKEHRHGSAFRAEADHAQLPLGVLCHALSPMRAQ